MQSGYEQAKMSYLRVPFGWFVYRCPLGEMYPVLTSMRSSLSPRAMAKSHEQFGEVARNVSNPRLISSAATRYSLIAPTVPVDRPSPRNSEVGDGEVMAREAILHFLEQNT